MINPALKMSSESRRQFIADCAKATLGVSVFSHANKLMGAAQPAPAGVGGKAKSVIYLYMAGGMSHIDTFDPKTGDTKGFSNPISTSADFQLSGYMTNMAKQADKISIVRSMITKTGVHQSANYMMHTGYEPRSTIVHPSLGPWAQHFQGKKGTLPFSVTVNPGDSHPGAGFFPPALSPIPIGNPDGGLQNTKPTVSEANFSKRVELMNAFDAPFRDKFKSQDVKNYNEFYDETLKLMKSEELKAFDISQESAATKELYGNSTFGKGAMLARRLVQNGVRFVEVQAGGWDMHNTIDNAMNTTGKDMDKVFAALVQDLAATGLLESTLVVLASEFGRTPGINENSGRDHYPIFCSVFAGGGIKGGYIHGSTDAAGKAIADKQVSVTDFIATIGAAMGLPVAEVVMSPTNRPFTVGDKGTVVAELFA
ncbi:MAG: DUF1501 domain-containing protein [Verrucomicrobiaceae bacterium]|nr:DUF1501 domain-containing protein [Verrucomicrobiaceae bacterium]